MVQANQKSEPSYATHYNNGDIDAFEIRKVRQSVFGKIFSLGQSN
jgi:hypothetical protein